MRAPVYLLTVLTVALGGLPLGCGPGSVIGDTVGETNGETSSETTAAEPEDPPIECSTDADCPDDHMCMTDGFCLAVEVLPMCDGELIVERLELPSFTGELMWEEFWMGALGDVDDDGVDDVIAFGSDWNTDLNGLGVLLDGEMRSTDVPLGIGGSPYPLHLDGDASLDLLLGGWRWHGDGHGQFEFAGGTEVDLWFEGFHRANFPPGMPNADDLLVLTPTGVSDVDVWINDVDVWINDGDGFSITRVIDDASTAVAGDFLGLGHDQIAYSQTAELMVKALDGDPQALPVPVSLAGARFAVAMPTAAAAQALVAELVLDGDNPSRLVGIWREGVAQLISFGDEHSFGSAGYGEQLMPGDVDDDGDTDLIIGSCDWEIGPHAQVLVAQADGYCYVIADEPLPGQVIDDRHCQSQVGDIDGDGDDELLTAGDNGLAVYDLRLE